MRLHSLTNNGHLIIKLARYEKNSADFGLFDFYQRASASFELEYQPVWRAGGALLDLRPGPADLPRGQPHGAEMPHPEAASECRDFLSPHVSFRTAGRTSF